MSEVADRASPRSSLKHLGSALLWFVGGVLVEVVISLVCRYFSDRLGFVSRIGQDNSDRLGDFVASVAAACLMIRVAWSMAVRYGGASPRAWLGDTAIQHPMKIGLLVTVQVAHVFGMTWWWVHRGPPHGPLPALSWWSELLVLVTAVLVGPLWEEVFFRGWLWAGLSQDWGIGWAASVTSLLWFACHLPGGWEQGLLLIPAVITVAAARQIGGSVRASLLLHASNNAASVLAISLFAAS